MLKETETEETTSLFVTFLSLVVLSLFSIGGPQPPPLSTPVVHSILFQSLYFTIMHSALEN